MGYTQQEENRTSFPPKGIALYVQDQLNLHRNYFQTLVAVFPNRGNFNSIENIYLKNFN